MSRAIGLVRVSTEDQKEIGYGIPEQVEKIKEHITRRNYQLVEETGFATSGIEYIAGFFQEDYTGKTALRPAIAALQEAITKHHIHVAVIHRTNRLGRRGSVQEVLEASLQAQGVRVEYVNAQFDTTTPVGRAMRRISGVFDELDYENIIHQLAEGKAQAVKQGSVIVTRPPYGYETVKVRGTTRKTITILRILEGEAAIIELIFQWYLYGDTDGVPLSINAIARKLTEQRIPTRWDTSIGKNGEVGLKRRKHEAGVWSDFAVHTILTSETYIGRWAYRKTTRSPILGTDKTQTVKIPKKDWIWVDIPPIITDIELFQAVQERIKHNTIMAARNSTFNYLFRGMFRCATCGLSYCGGGPPKYRPRYRCSGHRKNQYIWHCDMPNFFEDELESIIWPWIREIISQPEKIDEALVAINEQASQQNGHILALLKTTEALVAEYKTDQARVMELYKKGKLDADRWEVEDQTCQRKILEQEAQKLQLEAQLIHTYYSPAYIRDVKESCAHIAEGMDNFTRDEKRETFDLLDLHGKFAIEEGDKVVYAECILDARRLTIKSSGGSGFANKSS